MSDEANNRDDSRPDRTDVEGIFPWAPGYETELARLERQLFDFLIQEFLGFFNIEPFLEKVRQEGTAFIRDKVGDSAQYAPMADQLHSSLEAKIPELIVRAYEAGFFSHITVLHNTLGLGKFNFDRIAFASYLAFTEEYDIGRDHDTEMMTAIELCARWGNSSKEFEKNARNLPIYLFSRKVETWTCITDRIPSLAKIAKFQKSPDGWERGLDVPNPWFSVAPWWRIKRTDAEFYEKLTPKIGIAHSDLTLEWFSYDELLDRWNISFSRLEEAITGRDLKVYMLLRKEGIVQAPVQLTLNIGHPETEFHRECLFGLDDVHQFERNNLEFIKIAENVCDRKQAQDLARKWLRETPNLRSGAIVKRLRQESQFKHISRDETLATYVRALITNKAPGRPTKKNKTASQ